MGNAINIVEKIMQDQENFKEYGLIFQQQPRKWKMFNILVGENGSGKSRTLKMIKEKAPEKCVVIYLDFAKYISSSISVEGGENVEGNSLLGNLFFRDVDKRELFIDFLDHLDNEIVSVFNELYASKNTSNRYLHMRVEEILNDLRPVIRDILKRNIIVEDGIYLYKENRKVTIAEEWELLSPGERSILMVILAVLFIKLVNTPCILLIDEMETHLHPDAQVKLYKFLKHALEREGGDYCVCLASHSIFLLPLFKIHEIVYINNGEIGKINGGLYQQIYDNLTGEGDKKEESLTDFLYSMSAWQYADYLAQCFLEPTTVDEVRSDDEQALKFVEALKGLRNREKKLEVLDFGAGSARIGRCIELMLKDNNEVFKLVSQLTYHIYDKYNISDEFQENTVWRGRAFQTENDIIGSGMKFDIILLYNVLHEIGIDDWVEELGLIFDLLAEDGFLLFGEREILSVGEKPYGKSGYLVLGREEITKLFPESEITEIPLPEKQKAVTLCFAVKKPRTKAGYPSIENVKVALKSLRDNTRGKIRNREKNGLGERGQSRKYAFYCQQYVNAEEAIEIMAGIGNQKKKAQEQDDKDDRVSWSNNNTTLADIIQSTLPRGEQLEKIKELAQENTEKGKECRAYLEAHKYE